MSRLVAISTDGGATGRLGFDQPKFLDATAFLLCNVNVTPGINGDAVRESELPEIASWSAAKVSHYGPGLAVEDVDHHAVLIYYEQVALL